MHDILAEVRRVLGEVDDVLKVVVDGAERAGVATDQLQESLDRARAELVDLERRVLGELRQGWKSTDRYVRDNAWVAIGAAAAIGLLAGILLSRRK